MSVDLFVRTDGKPMVFLMNYVIEREDVRRAVEERGGVLVEDISPSICDNVIRLLARTEMAISRNYDMFNHRYFYIFLMFNAIIKQILLDVALPVGMFSHVQNIS